MYRPHGFALNDVTTLHQTIGEHPFAAIACARDGRVVFGWAPVVQYTSEGPFGTLHFHLARANELAALAEDGARLFFSFKGPDAYVSPDWYATSGLVPTWNSILVEGEGVPVTMNDEGLRGHLAALAAQEEEKISGKMPWTLGNLDANNFVTMMKRIVGFSVKLEKLEGKFKLSQNRKPEDIAGVIAGLEARGDPASLNIAKAMKAILP